MATSMRGIFMLFNRNNFLSVIRARGYVSESAKRYLEKKAKSREKSMKSKSRIKDERPVANVVLSDIMSDRSKKEELGYQEFIDERLNLVRKTVLIQTESIDSSVKKLERFGPIQTIRHIKKDISPYHMVTFQDEESVQNLVSSHGQNDPVVKRLIKDGTFVTSEREENKKTENQTLTLINEELQSCNSIDDQLHCLYQHVRLDDTRSVLIFLYYSIIHDVFNMISPGRLEPFGSCVNGFGTNCSDLDLMHVDLQKEAVNQSDLTPMFHYELRNTSANLRNMTWSLNHLLPIIETSSAIPARIPVIRLSLKPLQCQMDIAFTGNRQGIIISEIFYTYSLLDKRIPILFAFIKTWALENNIRRQAPGKWFSSFQLLALVIFYFQQRPNSTIPSIKTFLDYKEQYTNTVTPKSSPPLYMIRSLLKNPTCESSLETLLKEFFHFYATFNFNTTGLSLLLGQTFEKTNYRNPIQCEFPFDFQNVMKNVDAIHTSQLQKTSKKTLLLLEKNVRTEKLWGLISCLNKDELNKINMKISVQGLFRD